MNMTRTRTRLDHRSAPLDVGTGSTTLAALIRFLPRGYLPEPARRSVRSTKILATIGPASSTLDQLRAMIRAGANGFRVNFSHGDDPQHLALIRAARQAARRERANIAIVGDLQGPKIRLGPLDPSRVQLVEGSTFLLDRRVAVGGPSRATAELPGLGSAAKVGDPVLLGDGDVELRVEEVAPDRLVTRVVQGGMVSSHAGLFLPRAHLRTSILAAKDRHDLGIALRAPVDYLALSFVRSAEDIRKARKLVQRVHPDANIGWIAKIERAEALEAIDGILSEVDGIMIARGDLGIEVPLERLALEQKRLVRTARSRGRSSIVATQMLLSMVHASRPTRAEATDVANAVLDGTDAVMLSEESAIGEHPVEAVAWLDRIARATEPEARWGPPEPVLGQQLPPEDAVANAAVRLALDLNASAILTPTHSGCTPRLIACRRPGMPIVGLSSHANVRARMALVWGTVATEAPGELKLTALREYAPTAVRRAGLPPGPGPIVVTAGYPVSGLPTNLVTSVSPSSRSHEARRSRPRPVARPGSG
jgi:pyruvate kinase